MRVSSDFIIYVAKLALSLFSHKLLRIGHVADLASDELHAKSEIWKYEHPEACCFLKVALSWERLPVFGIVAMMWHFVRRFALWRHRSLTWPDLKMKKRSCNTFWGVRHVKFQFHRKRLRGNRCQSFRAHSGIVNANSVAGRGNWWGGGVDVALLAARSAC